jgi:hypothetical protein
MRPTFDKKLNHCFEKKKSWNFILFVFMRKPKKLKIIIKENNEWITPRA